MIITFIAVIMSLLTMQSEERWSVPEVRDWPETTDGLKLRAKGSEPVLVRHKLLYTHSHPYQGQGVIFVFRQAPREPHVFIM